MSLCKKCSEHANIVLRKKDLYCTDCFLTNVNHKFRACIGKNKILARNENVLVCLSGGPCSTVLLDLINNGMSLNNHKKLRITPVFFHIMGMAEETNNEILAKSIIKQCNHYKFSVYVEHISKYILRDNNVQTLNTIPQVNNVLSTQFNNLLYSMSVSSKNDFLNKVCRDLYIHYSELLQCEYIFTGETLGTLATNLLTNLTIGRGSQAQYDVGFCDSRNKINIIRPMKDISQEEIDEYIIIKQLALNNSCINQEKSLQSIIKNFVTDLQGNYQATISTVCKTADKIGAALNHCNKCQVCESDIGENSNKLSALDATIYSSTVSAEQQHSSLEPAPNGYSIFPYINETLCYACSKMLTDMDFSSIPLHIKEKINKGVT